MGSPNEVGLLDLPVSSTSLFSFGCQGPREFGRAAFFLCIKYDKIFLEIIKTINFGRNKRKH